MTMKCLKSNLKQKNRCFMNAYLTFSCPSLGYCANHNKPNSKESGTLALIPK